MHKASDHKRIIANRLREARRLAGLSQGQVARLLGVHRPTISEIEAGHRRVSADELAGFAEVYGVGVAWLFGVSKIPALGALRDIALTAEELDPVDWTDERNARRCELIDRQIQGTLSEDDTQELVRLQQAMRRHLNHVAPLPVEGAKRLHAELLRKQQPRR